MSEKKSAWRAPMPKPPSRPKCPSCFGTCVNEMFDLEGKPYPDPVPCFYCDGTGFDNYWMGPVKHKEFEDEEDC